MKDFVLNTCIALVGIILFAYDLSFAGQVLVGVVSIAAVRGSFYLLKGE